MWSCVKSHPQKDERTWKKGVTKTFSYHNIEAKTTVDPTQINIVIVSLGKKPMIKKINMHQTRGDYIFVLFPDTIVLAYKKERK